MDLTLLVLTAVLAVGCSQENATTTDFPTEFPTDPIDPSFPFNSICDAITSIEGNPASNDVQCQRNSICNGLLCQLQLVVGERQEPFLFEMNVVSCTSRPGVKLFLSNFNGASVLLDQVFYESTTVNFTGEYSFIVDVLVEVPSPNTLAVQVRVEDPSDSLNDKVKRQLPGEPLQVIEYTEFPLANVICAMSTCQAMLGINQLRNSTCHITQTCDGISCPIPVGEPEEIVLALTRVIPCTDPVSVQIIIDFEDLNLELLNVVVSERASIPVMFLGDTVAVLEVVVDQLDDALALQISAQTENGTTPVLDYTYIPYSVDNLSCEYFNPTCLALETVSERAFRSGGFCPTFNNCTGVRCFLDLFGSGALFPVEILPEACDSTVTMVIREPPVNNTVNEEGGIILQRNFRQNSRFDLFGNRVIIRLDRTDEAVGFEFSIRGAGDPIIPYAVIPLNDTGLTCGAPRMEVHLLGVAAVAVSAVMAILSFV